MAFLIRSGLVTSKSSPTIFILFPIDLVKEVNDLLPKYNKAVITNRESAPTIFFLFFGKYDPSSFQKEIELSSHRSFDRINFGKYEFVEEECPLLMEKNVAGEKVKDKNSLYVNSGLCKETMSYARILKEIKRVDGSLVFYIADDSGLHFK